MISGSINLLRASDRLAIHCMVFVIVFTEEHSTVERRCLAGKAGLDQQDASHPESRN